MADLNLYNSTQYIEDEWLNLVSKYFPDDNISLMKTGLFGYVNEIMAQEVKNSMYHKNFIYDEYLLNTASTSKSIYNFAKLYNVPVDNATPAKVSAILAIRDSDLVKESVVVNNLADNGNIEQSIISRKTEFTLNNKLFLLPYDIQILFNRNVTDSSAYVVSANYLIDDTYTFPYLESNSAILKTWDDMYNGEKFIYIRVDLFQLTCKSTSSLVINEANLYNTFYKFAFDGQLAFFKLSYEYNGVVEPITILNNNNYSLAGNQKYCYYNIIDDGTLEISFSSLFNSFRPEYGARLLIDIYTTEGAAGNLGMVSDLTVTYGITDFENSTPMLVEPITDCSGGKDKTDLLELKKRIVNKNLTRNSIVTDYDLNNFFNSVNKTENINNSEVRFVKKRNDILRKIYGAYILLRDTNQVVVPTRTIDKLSISANQIAEMTGSDPSSFTIPERSIIVYDTNSTNYFLVTKEVEIKKYINNSQYLLYSCPYLIHVNTDNYLDAKYYKTYTNKALDVDYVYVNSDIPYKFMVSAINIVRNSLQNEVYTLSINLSTNINLSQENIARIKIRGVLKNSSGNPYGYFEFKRSDSSNMVYEAKLSSEKYDGIYNGKLNIYNSLFNISTEAVVNPDGSTSLSNAYIEEDSILEIQVLYKSQYSSTKYKEANNMPDLVTSEVEKYASAAVFGTKDTLKLFEDYSKVTDSTVVPIADTTGVVIRSIPVLERNYFEANIMSTYNTLMRFRDLIESNLYRLEIGTEVDIKFFNTHGPSNMFYVKSHTDNLTGKSTYTYLDRIDLDLKLDIYLESIIGEDKKEEIAKTLSDYIESLNKKGVIAMSNIVAKLEKQYDCISYIEWQSINDSYYQKIVNAEYDGDVDYEFTPEFINIRKGLNVVEGITTSSDESQGVIINSTNGLDSKYKYSLTINYK